MLILKTRKEHFDVVIEREKHAVGRIPRSLRVGNVILLAKTIDGLMPNQKPIAYAAFYNGVYEDKEKESLALWGKQWSYIIELRNVVALEKPFAMSEVQVSIKNYGAGVINYAYVDEKDAEEIVKRGYLRPLVGSELVP